MTEQNAIGIDIASENQVFWKRDESELIPDFAIIKLSQGTWMSQTSKWYNRWKPGSTALDTAKDIAEVPVRMAYHFLDYEYGTYQQQADFFLQLVDEAQQLTGQEFHKLYYDMEEHRSKTIKWDNSKYWVYGKKTVDAVRYTEDRIGEEVGIYTGPSDYLKVHNADFQAPELDERDHWWAQYPLRS